MSQLKPRIALIHATPVAIKPVNDAFERLWPAAEVYNLLDDSLAPDLEKEGALTARMGERFMELGRYVAADGADGILFTCSAFGNCIETVATQLAPLPVLKPNEAMFSEAIAQGDKVGMIATFAPSVTSMEAEFKSMAQAASSSATIKSVCVPDALKALLIGDAQLHNRIVTGAANELNDCALIILAQFSTAQAKEAVSKATSVPVLTSPDSAVRFLIRYYDDN